MYRFYKVKNRLYLIVLVLLFSCGNSINEETNEVDTPKSELERNYELAETLLQFDAEKIGLLAVIRNVPEEKVYSVLRDYLAETVTSSKFIQNKESKHVVMLVDSIATKNNLSRELTASIIFGYQYELNNSLPEMDDEFYYQDDSN